MLQIRLAWGLINVSDPSSGTVLYETDPGPTVGTAPSDGIRVGVAVERGGKLTSALPATRDGKWSRADFRSWHWPRWTMPVYHTRLKPVYDSLRSTWSRWEEAR
jgi:hypothetical protein